MIYTQDQIRQMIAPIAEKYHLKAVFLFGSYARGDATESSDVDLLVDTAGTSLKSLLSLGALYCDLEAALGKPIDLVRVSTLEQKELLKGLFDESQVPSASDSQIQVYIGDETPVKTMKDCSVVTANYVLGDGLRGTIGIIGPKRMDYEKVVGTLRTLVTQLNETFNKQQ